MTTQEGTIEENRTKKVGILHKISVPVCSISAAILCILLGSMEVSRVYLTVNYIGCCCLHDVL